MNSTIYIGIDPSLAHTGLTALDNNGYLSTQPIITKPAYNWRDQVARERHVIHEIDNFIGKYCRTLSVQRICILVEDYAPGRYMKTTIPTIELGGQLRAYLFDLSLRITPQITIDFVAPSRLKQFTTGKGNADKVKVAVALATRFNVDLGGDDNLWDSYGLARIVMALDGECSLLSKEQLQVVEKIKYPKNGR